MTWFLDALNMKGYSYLDVLNSKKLVSIEHLFQKHPKLRKKYVKFLQRIFGVKNRIFGSDGIYVMKMDWDYLIILDAFRFDSFEKYNTINGKLSKVISRGSHTGEWIKRNFNGKYKDVVYVSSNPQISEFLLKKTFGFIPFYHIENVWDYGWDEKIKACSPSKTTEAAIKVIKEYPDKRVIIHYLQPHAPFIKYKSLIRYGVSPTVDRSVDQRRIWHDVEEGKIDVNIVEKGYIENSKLVLKEVNLLIKRLHGKIVITADHGNCFGELFLYGHPSNIYIEPLVQVPWLVIGEGKRIKAKEGKRVEHEDPFDDPEERSVKEKLKALGYLD